MNKPAHGRRVSPFLQAAEKEANARYQLWKSLYDFIEKSHNWTEDPILDEVGEQTLKIESIRSEVDDYGMRAYKMAKANKDDKVVERLKECIEDFKQARWCNIRHHGNTMTAFAMINQLLAVLRRGLC